MLNCYRVKVILEGHHHVLTIVAEDEAGAAMRAHELFTDTAVRANTMYWPGTGKAPVVGLVAYQHEASVHGSGPERKRMAAKRREARDRR